MDGVDLVHRGGGRAAARWPCLRCADAQLIHLVDDRADGVHGFPRAGDLRGDEHVERAVRVQAWQPCPGVMAFSGAMSTGTLHAVLPVFHLTGIDLLLKFSLIQFSKSHRHFQFKVGVLVELIEGEVVVAGDDHPGLWLRSP